MAELSSKAKGAAKQAATALKGRTGIYATLAKEHGEVSSLLKQAIQTSKEGKRQELVTKIQVELLSHAKAEENTLYRALQGFEATKDLAKHSREEHQEIESLLTRISRSPVAGEAATSALTQLRDTVEHHVKEEESELFERASEVLSKQDEQNLDRRFKQEKQAEKQRLLGQSFGAQPMPGE